MKLIIDISEEDRKDIGNIHFVREDLKFKIGKAIMNGTPLDEVKNKILGYNVRQHVFGSESFLKGIALGMDKSVEILDNIGEGE